MTKDLTAAEKGRKTKLSKMSNEELIKIILRKDETEHKYSRINKCLKENIKGLENKIKVLKVDISENESRIVDFQNDNIDLHNKIVKFEDEVKSKTAMIEVLNYRIDIRKRDLRRLVYIIIVLGIANIIQGIISLI